MIRDRRTAYGVLLVLLVVLMGCEVDPDAPVGPGRTVEAYVEGDELIVVNATLKRIWTFAIGQRAGATVLWGSTLEGESIAAGQRQRIPLDEVMLAPEEELLLVYYWSAVVASGEVVPGPVRSLDVALE